MATVARRPLASRTLPFQLQPTVSPLSTTKTGSTATVKRPRSPDGHDANTKLMAVKRSKCSTVTPEHERKEREKRKAEREASKEEFRVKYTKAFPQWVFYFHTTDAEKERLGGRVMQLGARVTTFFSNVVTHVISNHAIPPDTDANKENSSKGRPTTPSALSVLKSPIKLKGRPVEENCPAAYDALLKKAVQLGMKIWDTAKLDSVLTRCLVPSDLPSLNAKTPLRSLSTLLESERRHGTTSERDPTQKRHDYRYFAKNSYFVLVEDIQQELATIAAMEYPIKRESDGKEKGTWPVLYCHPLSRGPFIEYNEKEERKRERIERAEKERERERAHVQEIKKRKMQLLKRQPTDLRRSVSMSNLHRKDVTHEVTPTGESAEDCDFASANVSGYLASTGTGNYMAASGNSVGITSTYGTTSTAGAGSSRHITQLQLPAGLRGRLQKQVVTSRRVSAVEKASASSAMMPPPVGIPDKRPNLLRKSKSTNTLRLPKRDESTKPGYCESCRMKFDDFKMHVKSKKHVKFATNDVNFLQLDYVLTRVARRTIEEVKAEQCGALSGGYGEQEQERHLVTPEYDDDMEP